MQKENVQKENAQKIEAQKKRSELYIQMGNRMREYRTKLHYTQETTAEILEMSTAYYGKIERGVNGLSIQKQQLAHERLGIDLNYLISGEKPRDISLDELLADCPREKRYEMEQLIRFAKELAKK